MQQTNNIRFSVAITLLMTMSLIAYHAKAAAMIIDESHQNALQSLLKDQKLAFGTFDVLSFWDVRNAGAEDGGGNGSVFDSNSKEEKERLRKAAIIDEYFDDRNMPLKGHGKKFVDEAEKNNLDWRLLPALAIRESSGGKFGCDNNPFGWGSCKINFKNVDEAIETVALNLGGSNPRTKQYYDGDTLDKLYSYNGTVIKGYEKQVFRIMRKIADEEVAML